MLAALARRFLNNESDAEEVVADVLWQAWRDAICEIYLQVDCDAEKQYDYVGFVREARLGTVTLTDTFCSPQSIRRQSHHIAHFDKDYYYLGIEHLGVLGIHQAGTSHMSCAATPARANSGLRFPARPSTAGSNPGGRRSSRN